MSANALNPSRVKHSIQKILEALNKNQRKQVELILGLLNADGFAKIADIHDDVFFNCDNTASANKALNRLTTKINETAQTQGLRIRVHIAQDKKAGTEREVWFEGAEPILPTPYNKELSSIPKEQLEEGLRASYVEEATDEHQADVLIMVFNDHEFQQALVVFQPEEKNTHYKLQCTRNNQLYFWLGVHNKQRVVLKYSSQGQQHTLMEASQAIETWHPKAIIGMGIAFGIDSSKQNIGDVLISTSITPYEIGKVQKDGNFQHRGAKPKASPKLTKLFKDLQKSWLLRSGDGLPNLELGCLLSGEKLIDNQVFRDKLKAMEPEAIGGEMEGSSIEHAASEYNINWIVVKAICDWGDGNKGNTNKESEQQSAANNAAITVLAALNHRSEFKPTPNKGKDSANQNPRNHYLATKAHHKDLADIDEKALMQGRASLTSMDKSQANVVNDNTNSASVVERILEWSTNTNDPPVFALLGEYGMGKTITTQIVDTELRKQHQVSRNNPISLHFDLRNVTGMDKGEVPSVKKIITDCIESGWHHPSGAEETTIEDIYQWCAHGAVIIFDGLDEILVKLTENDGRVVTSRLFKFLDDVKRANNSEKNNIKLILSCRTQYFRSLREQRNHFTGHERGETKAEDILAMVLLPLSEEQILTYLKHAIPSVEPKKIKELIDSVHNLRELSERPVTLKFIGDLIPAIEQDFMQGKTINGVNLYRRMVERWLDRDEGKHHIKPEHKMQLASHLAAHLWQEGSRRLPANKIENWFHKWLMSNEDIKYRYTDLHRDKLEEDLRTATFLSRYDTPKATTNKALLVLPTLRCKNSFWLIFY